MYSTNALQPHSPITHFSEEERGVQMAAREWARKRLKPLVREMDNNSKICPSILEDLFTHGFMGLEVPEEYGGMACNFTSTCLAVEEIARVDPSVAILVDIHNTLTINALRFWGSPDLQRLWLPRLCQGTISSFALSEAESGSDAFAMKTSATLSEDGYYYTVNGTKLWISNAKEAGVFLLFANVDPSKGYKGITAFLIDADAVDGGTIHVGTPEQKLGLRASSTCPVFFENVRVPYTSVLGDVGKGYKVSSGWLLVSSTKVLPIYLYFTLILSLFSLINLCIPKYCINILNEGRIGIAAQQIGIAKGCLDIVMPYLNERKQFGTVIGNFQVSLFSIPFIWFVYIA
jgi:short/branched chain acyl-CoA dehydrogenase